MSAANTFVDTDTPFHDGELAVQERMGVRETIAPWARQVVRPYMPAQHRAFYESLPFMVVAARDADGRAWASLLAGTPGFISTPDESTLAFATNVAVGDGLDGALTPGTDIGLLGIQFADRRRNRVNGRISLSTRDNLTVAVDQTFGNCPQYIAPREWIPAQAEPAVQRSTSLDATQRAWICAADTFFIASGYRDTGEKPAFGMDASHRGGPAGFVSVEDDNTLVFADFAGNNHFNTLGNLVKDPRVGLLFVDFEKGSLLQLSGRAEIDWDGVDAATGRSGSRRVQVHIEHVIELANVLPMRWHVSGVATRALRVIAKEREAKDAMSFYLAARDDGELPGFTAGQHLPLELAIPEDQSPVTRTYSLSAAPDAGHYRISVKREAQGQASRFLHDHINVGDFLNAATPAGDFVLQHGTRPVVLLSAGIGITPMMSMLETLAGDSEQRPVTFIHSARDGTAHVFADAVTALGNAHEHIHVHINYSRPRPEDVQGTDYDTPGRLDAQALGRLLIHTDADCYLCGPAAFLGEMTAALEALGVPEAQIFSERFGA